MRNAIRIGVALVLAGLVLPSIGSVSSAAEFTVSSEPEFQDALTTAATNGEADTITLAAGSIAISNTLNYVAIESNALLIQGDTISGTQLIALTSSLGVLLELQAPTAQVSITEVAFQGFGGTGISVHSNLTLSDSSASSFGVFVDLGVESQLTTNRTDVSNSDVVLRASCGSQAIAINSGRFENNATVGKAGCAQDISVDSIEVIGQAGLRVGTVFDLARGGAGGESVSLEVTNSSFSNLDHISVIHWSVSNASREWKLYGNTFREINQIFSTSCDQQGCWHEYMALRTRLTLESNLFVSVDSIIYVDRIFSQPGFGEIRLANNTFVNVRIVLEVVTYEPFPDPPITFSNNLFYAVDSLVTTGWSLIVSGASNAVDRASLGGLFTNAVPFFTVTRFNPIIGFNDPVSGDYSLTEGSDLVDAGSLGLNAYPYDLAGQIRTVGGSVDIGAYELATIAPTIVSFYSSGEQKVDNAISFHFEVISTQGYSTTIDFGSGEVPATWGMTYVFDVPGEQAATLTVLAEDGTIARRTLPLPIRDLTLTEKLAEAHSEGFTTGYSDGLTDGAASVDTQYYYDSGYLGGYDSGHDSGYGACFAADGAGDVDQDGIVDGSDNCLFVANPVQTDTDHDGYGNLCDADINNDGFVGFDDASAIIGLANTNSNLAADLNGDGFVGLDDVSIAIGRANTLPGPSGYSCAGTVPCGPGFGAQRFVACSDGLTVEDNETGLLWERKTGTPVEYPLGADCSVDDCTDSHHVNNYYRWSSTGTAADGNAFSDFLASLNTSSFAGHADWRLPIISELQTIIVGPGVSVTTTVDPLAGENLTGQATVCNSNPCVDPQFASVAGPTTLSTGYKSASTNAADADRFWYASSPTGNVYGDGAKLQNGSVRAVRTGSCAP